MFRSHCTPSTGELSLSDFWLFIQTGSSVTEGCMGLPFAEAGCWGSIDELSYLTMRESGVCCDGEISFRRRAWSPLGVG